MAIKKKPWRLLDSGPSRGSFNLALDEAIYRLARAGSSPPTVRFYDWSTPAISVGCFQSWEREIDLPACRRKGLEIYRRITGGRAVLHHREVTYSVVSGRGRSFFGEGKWPAYRKIGRALVAGLKRLGVEARFAPPVPGREKRGGAPHPACFYSCNGYEIVAGGGKLIGSAQKRQGEAFLQQGSVPLSSHAGELAELLRPEYRVTAGRRPRCALDEILDSLPTYREVVEALSRGFDDLWGERLVPAGITAEELRMTAELERTRYLSPAWNGRRKIGNQWSAMV